MVFEIEEECKLKPSVIWKMYKKFNSKSEMEDSINKTRDRIKRALVDGIWG